MALVGLLALAGCSSSDSGSEMPSSNGAAAPFAPGEADRDLSAGGAKGDAGNGYTAVPPEGVTATGGPVETRSIIYRGDITVRVEKVGETAERLKALVETSGGFLGADKRTADSGEAQAWLTVRVPAKQFSSVLEQIAKLGTEVGRNTNTEDVTEAVVDLDTRIAAQKASVDSVRRMFAQAKQLSEVVLLEKELSSRQAELASLEAKKRNLDNLVTLSTINVVLIGPHAPAPEPPKKKAPGFLGGLEAGWDAFLTTVQVVLAVLGFLLPFLVALSIPAGLLIWWSRRRRPTPPPTA
ncbi:lipoprotein [Catellatospora sp. TT07R-123]|nr:lipoprotein [Catellatospora sp. TT07R-123]